MVNPEPASVPVRGAEIRKRRKLKGHTLTQFAARCGITFQYLSQIERGSRPRVSPPVFAAICDSLGIRERGRAALVAASDEAVA